MKIIIISFITQLLSHNTSIPVNHPLAVQTLNVKKSITKQFVLVYHLILEVPPGVAQNALLVLSVLTIKHVQIRNVLTLVQILVAKTPSAE
jgi:hypothetical protein